MTAALSRACELRIRAVLARLGTQPGDVAVLLDLDRLDLALCPRRLALRRFAAAPWAARLLWPAPRGLYLITYSEGTRPTLTTRPLAGPMARTAA